MEVSENWIAEFILRHQQNPRVSTARLLSVLKLVDSDDSGKLKISAVLRDISDSLIRGRIDEEILDLLETLEKLLLQEHSVIMGSHISAYCWTAAECTLKFMWPVTASDGFFDDAIERIWKKRVGILKERGSDLVTSELLKWESDLKKAFEEPEIYQKIRKTNIRYNAISHLSQLLKEQWALLGCSSLELEARKRIPKRNDPPNASRKTGNDFSRAGDTVNNVNEEQGIGEREGSHSSNREKANDVEEVVGLQNPDGVEKVNEQEEEQEHEDEQEQEPDPSLNEGDKAVAQKLKGFLLKIRGFVNRSTGQEQKSDFAMELSDDVSSHQLDGANRSETVGAQAESSEGTSRVRPHLPPREPLNVSPLRRVRPKSPRPRRRVKFWTPEEVEALREGVKKFGRSWKCIKHANPEVLADRTEVDLKDKWRNYVGR